MGMKIKLANATARVMVGVNTRFKLFMLRFIVLLLFSRPLGDSLCMETAFGTRLAQLSRLSFFLHLS